MSEPTDRPPSPIPVPWPFHPPHELEPSHPLYNHVPRDRDQQATVQSQFDAEWAEFDREYQQTRSTRSRRDQTRQHTVAAPVPQQRHLQQHQPNQSRYEPPTDSRGVPNGGRERWRYLGRDYARDSPGSEWVVFGNLRFIRPELRYTPRGVDDGDGQGRQAAMSPVGNQPPSLAMGRTEMPLPQSGNGYSGSPAQPIDHSNATRSIPRPPSPPPVPSRPMDMRGDQGHAQHGNSGPSRSAQQDSYHDPRYPIQHNDVRSSSVHGTPIHPDAAAQSHHPATSHASNERLETREDPWEFLFGSKGYTTLAPGDERPFWWDWKD